MIFWLLSIAKYSLPMKCMYVLLVLALSANMRTLFAQNEQLDYAFHFETAKSKLPQEAQQSIAAIANKAKNWLDHSIIIQGHTDDIGTVQYNIQLSKSRAEEVKKMFVNAGIDEHRIAIKALGEGQPIVSNQYEEGRRTNRRVEILLTKDVAVNYREQQEHNQQVLNKLRPPIPKFVLNQAGVERYLKTEQGTQIHIPSDAFDVPKGTEVEVKVFEAYKTSDMILNGLSTMSNGKRLVTGGMMKVEAMSNGIPVQLKKGKYLTVNVPSKNPDQRMQLFTGDTSAQTINWVNPRLLAVNRPNPTVEDPFYQEFEQSIADERIYIGIGPKSARPEQIGEVISRSYLNENSNRPEDPSLKVVEPRTPDPIDSTRIKFWQDQLVKVNKEINAPCTTFACKWKAFFRSKKRKALLRQKNEDRIANIKRNIEAYKRGLASQEQKHIEYAQELKAFKAKKDSLYKEYLDEIEEWKVEVEKYDSMNFEYACYNKDIGYLYEHYENREKEACQRMYGVSTFEEAQEHRKESVMLDYVGYYMPKRNRMDSAQLKQFLLDYPTVIKMDKQFFKLACEKKDTNYIRWRKGEKFVKLALPIMYEVSTLKEARAAQLCEKIEARATFYRSKLKEYGVETIEEAYEAHQRILKERAEWKQQMGYVFSTANLGGWINCDYFPRRSNEELITQNFDLPVSPKLATTYLVFKDIASVMRGSANYRNLKNWYTFNNIPKNKAVQVVSFYLDAKGQTQVAVKSLLADETPEKLEYKPMSMEAFKKVLTNLDV